MPDKSKKTPGPMFGGKTQPNASALAASSHWKNKGEGKVPKPAKKPTGSIALVRNAMKARKA